MVNNSQFAIRSITQENDEISLHPCNPLSERHGSACSHNEAYPSIRPSDVELGDRTPPQLLRYLDQLIGNSRFDDSFMRHTFLGKISRIRNDMRNCPYRRQGLRISLTAPAVAFATYSPAAEPRSSIT